jgi:hypothetical protein
MTDDQWQKIWSDMINTSTYSRCTKCRRIKKLIGRETMTVNGLTITAPRRRCPACEPEGEK